MKNQPSWFNQPPGLVATDADLAGSAGGSPAPPPGSGTDPTAQTPEVFVETLASGKKRLLHSLVQIGIDEHESRREVDLILQHATGWSVAEQLLRHDELLSADALSCINTILEQRQRRVPLQYCLGEAWFMGLRFSVGPGVLIPRADTEILVETALELLGPVANPMFLDVGTGSGAIAIAMLHFRPDARAYAIDISGDAVSIAAKNLQTHNLNARLQLVTVDWEKYSCPELLDAIVSNPPYIPLSRQSELLPEVAVFEPKQALFGTDEDGLGFYRSLGMSAGRFLKPSGFIAVEVGEGQAAAVADIFARAGWKDVSMRPDLNRITRVVSAFRAS